MKRDGLSAEQALKRMNAQLSEQFFIENSDFIIKNNKNLQNVYAVSKEVSDKIKDYYYNKNKDQISLDFLQSCSE
ncbi:MAG TPA: dephospho-CoA kinase, partial [Ruminococcus sp.]|nr:dephospho-CoA kinase [Ruminococcus sp.]